MASDDQLERKADDRILVPISCGDRKYMNVLERDILKNFFTTYLLEVDPQPLIGALCEGTHISKECLNLIKVKCEKSPFWFSYEILKDEIAKRYPLRAFVFILYSIHFAQLANDLISYYNEFTRTRLVQEVARAPVGNRKTIQQYFKFIKKQVHEFTFKNPQADLSSIGVRLRQNIELEKNDAKRQFMYDRYVALKAAEIDALTNKTDDIDPYGGAFKDIEEVIDDTSNPNVSRVLLYGRKADVLSSLGRQEEGRDMLKEGFKYANATDTCIESVDMVYKGVVFRLSELEEQPSTELKEMLLLEASRGLHGLADEDEDVKIFWRRLFILRMIYSHLGIGKRCMIIPGYEISEESLREAERLLSLDSLEDLEHRRQMMYGVAKARLLELKGELSPAIATIRRAIEIAKEGNYTEMPMITHYHSHLQHKLKNMCIFNISQHTNESD
ncbi:uncharacterized protein LOC133181264 [Saccostrea echinata]|uniref:uncharacterized protein LOC133181264 n=1 Tax=Saccostrea echinata TaxID=191078 RepID=UPI002A80CE7E|nr:uncharacterized protein LOC133181264 [Saccostrea echinata]